MDLGHCQRCNSPMASSVIACPACGTANPNLAAGNQPQPSPQVVNPTNPQPAASQQLPPNPGYPLPTASPAQPQPQVTKPVANPATASQQPPPATIQPQPSLTPPDKTHLAKRIFFILLGLTGVVVVAIVGIFVFNLFGGSVDKTLEAIGVECQLTEVDFDENDDPEIQAIAKRAYDCEWSDNTYERLQLSDYRLLANKMIKLFEEKLDLPAEELRQRCRDNDLDSRYSSGFEGDGLQVGSYVFFADGSSQIDELRQALEQEGVDSQSTETLCEIATG